LGVVRVVVAEGEESRGKGDVGWRKLCWALIKACLGAYANCCGFWHETGVEGSCLHDRGIL